MSQAEASVLRLPVMRKIPLAPTSSALEPLLEVNGLSVRFRTRTGQVHALEDVGFGVGRGEIRGHRRRERLRQERVVPGSDGTAR